MSTQQPVVLSHMNSHTISVTETMTTDSMTSPTPSILHDTSLISRDTPASEQTILAEKLPPPVTSFAPLSATASLGSAPEPHQNITKEESSEKIVVQGLKAIIKPPINQIEEGEELAALNPRVDNDRSGGAVQQCHAPNSLLGMPDEILLVIAREARNPHLGDVVCLALTCRKLYNIVDEVVNFPHIGRIDLSILTTQCDSDDDNGLLNTHRCRLSENFSKCILYDTYQKNVLCYKLMDWFGDRYRLACSRFVNVAEFGPSNGDKKHWPATEQEISRAAREAAWSKIKSHGNNVVSSIGAARDVLPNPLNQGEAWWDIVVDRMREELLILGFEGADSWKRYWRDLLGYYEYSSPRKLHSLDKMAAEVSDPMEEGVRMLSL